MPPPPIEHVVVLVLENRSFDHMLGYLDHPDPAFDGLLRGGPHTNPGYLMRGTVAASPTAKPVLPAPAGPDHSHDAAMSQIALRGVGPLRRATNRGFVSSFERKGRGLDPPQFSGLLGWICNLVARRQSGKKVVGRGPLIMECQPTSQVPVLSRLALEFGVCTRWFCSVPGETWPNRNFLHAATSDGETSIELRPYTNRTIFDVLEENDHDWRIYHDDIPQVWAFPNLWDTPERHAKWYRFTDFDAHARLGDLPAYTFIEPNHKPAIHDLVHAPVIGETGISNSQHPENNLVPEDKYDQFQPGDDCDFNRGEALLASVYESLRANPALFERTVLLITYDEHGGLYDHVPPPDDVPSPGVPLSWQRHLFRWLMYRRVKAFDFRLLGPRVPAVVVSPYIGKGTVDATPRDHASVPSTLRALFAPRARPLTARDAWSPPFHTLLNLDQPRTDLPDLRSVGGFRVVAPVPTDTSQEVGQLPAYYQDFLALADGVRDHLDRVGEPEVKAAGTGPTATVEAFQQAAQRHREEKP